MKFTRIDENTVNCIIDPEDLREYGLRVDDLFAKKDEAMEFLHHVVEEAGKAVDYHPSGLITSMQMSVLPDHTISITLSENVEVQLDTVVKQLQDKLGIHIPEELLETLKNVPDEQKIGKLREIAAKLQLGAAEDGTSSRRKKDKNFKTDLRGAVAGKSKTNSLENIRAGRNASDSSGDGESASSYLVRFNSMRHAIAACKMIASTELFARRGMEAALYEKAEGSRTVSYMIFILPEEERDLYNRLILSLNEFGSIVTAKEEVLAHFKEQETCILQENTIETLAKL